MTARKGSGMKRRIACCIMGLLLALLTGCTGVPVVYGGDMAAKQPYSEDAGGEGLKTGLSLSASLAGSRSAAGAKFDVCIVAVTVDDGGVIVDCAIDGISADVAFDGRGACTGGAGVEVAARSEGAQGAAAQERQAALAEFARGKTLAELQSAAHAGDYPEEYMEAVVQAAQSADILGAHRGDELRLAVIGSTDGASASGGQEGSASLACDVAALTRRDGVITSCVLDGLQAELYFDETGEIASDIYAPVRSKNALGAAYGMKTYGGARREWREQAASFAAYVTGKDAAGVANIAVSEGKAVDSDISSTVTISIGGFQRLIAKAMGR